MNLKKLGQFELLLNITEDILKESKTVFIIKITTIISTISLIWLATFQKLLEEIHNIAYILIASTFTTFCYIAFLYTINLFMILIDIIDVNRGDYQKIKILLKKQIFHEKMILKGRE